jgi:hypothetical protein
MTDSRLKEGFRRWRAAWRARAVADADEGRKASASLDAWRRRFRPRRHLKGWEDKPPPPTGLSF